MEKETGDSTGEAQILKDIDEAKVNIHDDSDEDKEDSCISGKELTAKQIKRQKEKARKKAKKEKEVQERKEEEERMKKEFEGKDAYEVEVAWCIRQLKLGLTNKGVTKDQGILYSTSC